MKAQNQLRPFGARDKFGYFFGDVANDCTFILSTSIMLKFYTDVMGVSGWLLTAIGYNELASSQGIGQTGAVKDGIFNISTLVPAAGFLLLGVVLWFWYPLHKKQVDENNAILKTKREGK